MDKNQATGLVLLSIMLMAYLAFFGPEPQEGGPDQAGNGGNGKDTVGVIDVEKPDPKKEDVVIPDSLAKSKYGFFGNGKNGIAEDIVLENEDVKITLNTKGGTVKKVSLKKHVTFEKKELVLIDEENSTIKETIQANKGVFDLNSLYYVAKKEGNTVTFSISDEAGGSFKRIYSLPETGYVLNYSLKSEGIDHILQNKPIQFNWTDYMKKVEKEITTSRQKSTVNFFTVNEDFDYVSETAVDRTEIEAEAPVRWASMKQKFFNAAIITDAQFNSFKAATEVDQDNESIVKMGEMSMEIPYGTINSDNANLRYYFGPNDYDICETVTEGFEDNVYLGWTLFKPINLYVVMPMFQFFEKFTNNYGVIILLIVFIVKMALFPLTHKSYKGMAKMKVLKPEMDAIKEEHGDDMQKSQQEQMKLMSKFGVSPAAGCIPMIAQTPIWLAMFNFFPNAIQLRQQSFLWADDLSTYDSILDLPFSIPMYGDHVSLFTLLMTSVTLINTYYNNQMNPQAANQPGPLKYVGYFMPIMFLFFLNSFASGLTFYYFVSTTISIGQQLVSKNFLIDEKKIREKLEENHKKREKKGGSFQQRLMGRLQKMQEDAENAKAQQKAKANGQKSVQKRKKKKLD